MLDSELLISFAARPEGYPRAVADRSPEPELGHDYCCADFG
jgi:hypothetical protein